MVNATNTESLNARRTPMNEAFPVWSVTPETDECVERFEHLPTPSSLKDNYLFGIPLTSSLTGQTVTDKALQHYVNAAISEIEHEFDLYITPVTFKEKIDYDKEMFVKSYSFIQLKHGNVLDIEEFVLSFSNADDTEVISFPMEFVHVMPQEGVIQLVPAFGSSFSGFLLSAFSGTQFHAIRAMGFTNFPGGIRIKYRSGFAKDKVPSIIVDLIEAMSAYKILSMMGPVLFPHNSIGISIDGVSQSTSNPGPQYLATRMGELEKQIEKAKTAVRGYYQKAFQVSYF